MPRPPTKNTLRRKKALQKLGQKVRKARASLGLTMEALAEESGTSKSVICAIENGKQCPSMFLLGRIAESLNLPPSYFYE